MNRPPGPGAREAPHAAAFERVADALLAAPAETPLVLATAGCEAAVLAPVSGALIAAARRARIPLSVAPSPRAAAADPPAVVARSGSEPARIVLVNDGVIDETRLARCVPAGDPRPDLLLWALGRRSPPALRTLYLMGVWTWLRGAQRLRCLVVGSEAERAAAADAVAVAMRAAALPWRVEVLALAADVGEHDVRILEQVLRSALAAARCVPGAVRAASA